MKRLLQGFLFIAAWILFALSAWAHGVEGTVSRATGYLITARYDDGEAMSYAKVEITAPDADLPFQIGRTDRNGSMMFQPDSPGNWQVVITDGMGHRKSLDKDVSEGFGDGVRTSDTLSANEGTGRLISHRALSIVAGISIIFGLFGTIYGWYWQRFMKHHNAA